MAGSMGKKEFIKQIIQIIILKNHFFFEIDVTLNGQVTRYTAGGQWMEPNGTGGASVMQFSP